MPKTLFLSDLHLARHTPDFNLIFKQKISVWQTEYDALYLLGDIFNTWLGDDILEDYTLPVIQALKQFSEYKPLYFMHGNRDFLIGQQFLQLSGATLLPDPSLVKIYQRYYILSHGDLLCTDDLKYQKFRIKIRNPEWQSKILNKPKYYRRILAKSIRLFSAIKGKTGYQQSISDATTEGIQQLKSIFPANPSADMIHGHTHKPNVHSEIFIQQQNHTFKRYVLPDWRPHVHGGISINSRNELNYIYF